MNNEQNSRADASGGLDNLFRNSLGSQQIEPSKGLWKGISRKLLRAELAHFNFTNLPGKFWIGMAGLVLVGLVFLVNRGDDQKNAGKESSPAVSVKGSQGRSSTVPSNSATSISLNEEKKIHPTVQPLRTAETSIPDLNKISAEITKKKLAGSALNVPAGNVHSGLAATTGTEKSLPGALNLGHAVRNLYGIDLAFMNTPEMPGLFVFPARDTMMRFITPGGINNIPKGEKVIPQFYTFNLGVSPERSVYMNVDQYTETNYWLNAGMTYHAGKFSVQTGVGVGYVFDHGKYRVNYESRDSIGYFTSIISFIVTPGNVVVYTTKDIPVYDTLQHYSDDRTISRYTYIRIPLLVGYELFSTNRFSLGIKAGPALSFLIGSKEAQPFIDYPNARLIRVDDNSLHRVKMNWEIQAVLDLEYRIEKHFSLYAQPYYKHYFKSFMEKESTSVTDPYSIGIEVGARIHFGQKKD
jgi:hypothetical protein